jgi:hypothetical protein
MKLQRNVPSASIQVSRVPASERLSVLVRHFGRHTLVFESGVYVFAHQLSPSYAGGYWHFQELSNGGFFMSPQCGPLQLRVTDNGYEGNLSAEAAGITFCLFAFSHLSFRFPEPMFMQHFHDLRALVFEHPEAGGILAAID